MAGMFEGVRVVDFTQVLSGPYATLQMALEGADVVKLEQRGAGDQSRQMMMPKGAMADAATSAMFICMNAGKRSMTLDLKQAGAREVVRRLVEKADVLVQNYKAGTLDRMGFGYEAMAAINPRLVYCSITGYGQTGPRAAAAAYDPAIQAASGMMSLTGYEETGPTKAGFWVTDMATGITAAFAIAGALYRRSVAGTGQHLDVSMLDTAVGFISPIVSNLLNCGVEPFLAGNGTQSGSSVSSVYPTAHGYLQVAPATQSQFEAFCRVLGRPEIATDPRFVERNVRLANAASLREHYIEALAAADARSWEGRLAAAGVPAAAVQTVPEVIEDPQIKHREVVLDLAGPAGLDQVMRVVGAGFTTGEGRARFRRPAPGLGEHTDELLTELGFGAGEIAEMRAAKVV